jgi:hypothetical protein
MVRKKRGELAKPDAIVAWKAGGVKTLELTKVLRWEYEAVQDLVVTFRKFAKHTTVGSVADYEQAESLRMEATILAAELKQTVPTVMYDWLCQILHDEHLQNEEKRKRDNEKVQRHFSKL